MTPATPRTDSSAAVVPGPQHVQARAADAAQLLKALGNEQRLLILCHLLDGELSVGEINQRVTLSQSALSQHLALLRELGLVATRREAQNVYYSLPHGPVVRIMALLQEIYCPPGPAVASEDDGAQGALCTD